jgi:hypothetical protein
MPSKAWAPASKSAGAKEGSAIQNAAKAHTRGFCLFRYRQADAGFHPDQARRHVGEPRFHLAARPLLSQRYRAASIKAYHVKKDEVVEPEENTKRADATQLGAQEALD